MRVRSLFLSCCRYGRSTETSGGGVRFLPWIPIQNADPILLSSLYSSCTGSIASALAPANNPGIRSVDVNLLAASVTVVYDPSLLAAGTINDMIKDAGFGSEILLNAPVTSERGNGVTITSSQMETWKTILSISGMTCASCTTSISEELKNDPRIRKVDVNLLEASADIIHLAEMKAEEVKVLIEDIGFEADVISTILVENEDKAGNSRPMQRPTSESKIRTVRIGVEGIFCRLVASVFPSVCSKGIKRSNRISFL